MSYLPYKEPGITVILSLTAFIVLLNGIRYGLDKLLYCGLIGEIILGAIWGLPVGGTALLSTGMQEVIQGFGYLGLIGLVFEGGLSTSPTQLRKAMLVSVSVATVGLLMPIALSFLLLLFPIEINASVAYPSPLAAFSAGASLCSTSLGTTFAILSSANMQKTQTGIILVGAAMMDDIVGLVMINIVTTLGDGAPGAWPVARPIVASFGLLLVTLCITLFVLQPVLGRLSIILAETDIQNMSNRPRRTHTLGCLRLLILVRSTPHLGFIVSIFILLAFTAVATFIDASVLFAAFLAGNLLSHIWSCTSNDANYTSSAVIIFDKYYRALLDQFLVPFFFHTAVAKPSGISSYGWENFSIFMASIGFSIPVTNMFRGSIIWKGVVYAILMVVAKSAVIVVVYVEFFVQQWKRKRRSTLIRQPGVDMVLPSVPHIQALTIAAAMIARGEIGFLIASLSESSGALTLRQGGLFVEGPTGEDVFLVIVWAVVLCTIAGPVLVGILVRRQIRHIQPANRQNSAILS